MTPDLAKQLRDVWDDQRAFNLLLRRPPTSHGECAEQSRDFVLWIEDELHELLRAMPWKKHRKIQHDWNDPHIHEEAIDAFKLLISLLQLVGIDSLEQLIEVYWRKTAVVKQRYREEWTNKLVGKCVVVDIDHVLCDYVTGLCDWLPAQFEVSDDSASPELLSRIAALKRIGGYVDASSLGIPQDAWQMIKHDFRVSGQKRHLPVFADALPFLTHLRDALGLQIVLLTSRPIDRYPNIFTDTIFWLNENRLPYDFVWWATDKAERIAQVQDLKDHVVFAVDDDMRYVSQFAKAGIPTYWLQRNAADKNGQTFEVAGHDHIIEVVHSLSDITNR